MNEKMNEIQKAELSLAKKLKKVCEKEGLTCFLLGGAMLGAIRHQGFIPWDDDMDFGLLRDEYERLFEVLSSDAYELKVLSYKNNEIHDYPFKVIDPTVKLISNNYVQSADNYAWIDIFPIDGMPNNSFIRKIHEIILLKDRTFLKLSQLKTGVAIRNPNRTYIEKLIISVGNFFQLDKFLSESRMMSKLDKHLRKFHTNDSKYLVNFMGAYKFKEMFFHDVYLTTDTYKFENESFYGTKFYSKYLEQLYGDFMKLPNIEDRDKHKVELK